ncbi:PAS domain S-box protein [Chitinimonas naiadis]
MPIPEQAVPPLNNDEEFYRLVVESMLDHAIYIVDPDGRIRSWNAGAEAIFGYQEDDIIGRQHSVLYTAAAIQQELPARTLAQVTEAGRADDEGRRLRKDGSTFLARINVNALHAPAGAPQGFVFRLYDLSPKHQEEAKLHQSEERFRRLVESVKDYAIFMLDPEGYITSWNAGAIRIKGYQPEEIIGRHFSSFYNAEDNAADKPTRELAEAIRSGRVEDEGWRIRKDGSTFWANVVITALRDEAGNLTGFAKVTRDMSDRKRLEELENSSRLISQFLATLAHELRNPLAPIRNAVSLMQLTRTISPEIAQARDLIDRQLTHLTRLVDDLLDIGRITTGKLLLQLEQVELADIIAMSIEAARPLTESRQQQVRVEAPRAPIILQADKIRLVQVVQNLLNNASKFSPSGSVITVRIALDSKAVLVSVEDQGCGISESMLESIFDLFVQEDHGGKSHEAGLGLGLSLCRSLAMLHGGRIAASSPGLGKGSMFSLHLPLPPAAATTEAPGDSNTGYASPQIRILIIDDNRDSTDSLAILLQYAGHMVRTAYAGAPGLDVAHDFAPHLVLLDIAMPEMNGFEVLRQLRLSQRQPRPVMVAMTGFGQLTDIEHSLAAGFDMHLIKPVEMSEIQGAINMAISRASK